MNTLFYTALSLLILIIQTVAAPVFFHRGIGYDLFMPLVLHLGIFRPVREAIPVILVLGILAGSLSSAPFGIHLSSYLWYFALLRWGITFLHIRTPLFLPLILSLGVLFQEILFLAALKMSGNLIFSSSLCTIPARHLLWTAATGPPAFMLISAMHRKWHTHTRRLFRQKKQ